MSRSVNTKMIEFNRSTSTKPISNFKKCAPTKVNSLFCNQIAIL